MHFERENEGTSWYKTYWEQSAKVPSVTSICRQAGEAWVVFFLSVATSSLILHLFPSSECKTSYKYSSININIQKNFYLNRSCLRQNTILTDREMYLVVIRALGKWCGQIEVHYHACAVLVLIQLSQYLHSVMDLEPSDLKIAEGPWTTLHCFMECRDALVLKGRGVWFWIQSCSDS